MMNMEEFVDKNYLELLKKYNLDDNVRTFEDSIDSSFNDENVRGFADFVEAEYKKYLEGGL